MQTYDSPEIQELFYAWLDRLIKDHSDVDRDAAREAFNAGIDEIRADALHTASLASVNGIPLHITAPGWLNLQAGLYSDRIFRTEVPGVEKSPPAADLINVARPESTHNGEARSNAEIGELLFGASAFIRESSMFGSNLRATVATALWHGAEAVWANRYSRHYDAEMLMPRPRVPYGPIGISAEAADSDYLRTAARKIEDFYKPFTPEVRRLVAQLLRDIAVAIEALVTKEIPAEQVSATA